MAYDLGTAHGKIELEYTGKSEVDAAERDMDRLSRKAKDTDRDVSLLREALGGLGKGVAVSALAVGLTNAAAGAANVGIQVAGMVPALTSILSLSSALPAAFIGAAAAGGIVKASMVGVEDAVTEAFNTESAEKFNEALEKLSPSAAAFARSVKAGSGELRAFQQGLQESFFSAGDLASAMPQILSTVAAIRPAMQGLAAEMGSVVRQFVNLATSAESVNFVRSAIGNFHRALEEARPAIRPIVEGLREVGTVGQTLLPQLGAAIGRIGERFGNWLTEIANNGQLEAWIDTAIETLNTLGNIAQNIGGILNSVFTAAGQTGGGLLQTIEAVTGEFNNFLSSAEGQEAITALFTGIGEAARALAPVITTLVGALAGALGPALGRLATEFGPVLLEVVQALAPAFGPLADAFVSLVTAVAPLLPPLAQMAAMLAQLGAGVLTTLAQALEPLIPLLGAALTGALQAMAPVLQQVMTYLPQFAAVGLQLAQALLPLVPSVIAFANALVQALLPHLPALMNAFLQLVPPIVQIATIMGGQLASALVAIIPYLPQIITFLVRMQQTALFFVQAGLQFVTMLLRIGQVLVSMVGTAVGAVARFIGAIRNGIQTAIGIVAGAPGRFGGAISGLPAVLVSIAVRAWSALRGAFSSGISTAVGIARGLGGRVRGAISNLHGLIVGIARAAWASFVNMVRNGVSNAASAAAAAPGRIRSAIGNLGGLLVSAGADAIRGLVNGIRGAIGSAVSAAADAGRAVISGIKSTLKISSPSREMITIGRFVTQGLRIGLLGTAKQVQAAANKLANMVRDAYSDKLIKKGARNSVLGWLDWGSKELVKLVNRSNSVAAKLKTAQKNLADAQKLYNDQYWESVKQTRQSFQLVSQGQEFVNLDLTKDRFKEAVAQARQFSKDIAALQKRGLHVHLLEQLVEAGPEAGSAMARALATADKATIDQFTLMQKQLNGAADVIGKTSANALYGAGVNAAKAIVKGLQSQQKAIDKQMNAIANSMIKAIKKALKIKSPSRVMFNLGKFTSEGLADGIEALRRQVQQAAQRLATASILPTVRLGMVPPSTPGMGPNSGAAAGGTTTNVYQTVNALPGMNARQVGDYSLTKLRFGIMTGVSAAPIPTPSPAGV